MEIKELREIAYERGFEVVIQPATDAAMLFYHSYHNDSARVNARVTVEDLAAFSAVDIHEICTRLTKEFRVLLRKTRQL